jgi:branched-chain amino acid transport system permease protein
MNAFAIYQVVASGIATGCIYAILAISLIVIFKSTEVVNFAGGEVLVFGTYLGMLALMYFELPYVAAFGFAAIGMFAVATGFEMIVLRTIAGRHRHGPTTLVALVVATVGLAYILRGAVRLFSYTEEPRRMPSLFRGPPIEFGQALLQRQDIAIIVISILLMLALFAFFQFTLTGKALRAASQNARAATLVGIQVRRMRSLVWGGACALAGIAGVLIAAKLPITPDFGGSVVLLSFAAAIIGGFTSIPGCVIGGILLGIVQNLVGLFISSSAIAVAPFIVIMVVLVLRPQGLFGGSAALRKV